MNNGKIIAELMCQREILVKELSKPNISFATGNLITSGIERIDKELKLYADKPVTGLWQTCPKCDGQGTVVWPTAGLTSTTSVHQCNVCNGKMIISTVNGLPPGLSPNTQPQTTP